MKAEHTFAVNFIVRRSAPKSFKALIYVRIIINEVRVEISLKESISIEDWDTKKEAVRGRTEEVKALNKRIDDVRFKIKQKYRELEDDVNENTITAEMVKSAYLNKHKELTGHTVKELLAFHRKIQGPQLALGTLKNYGATEDYVQRFIFSKFQKDDIFLSQLNYQFIVELEHFIPNNPIKAEDPCIGNGVAKHIERLKKMVTWAKTLEWIKSDPFAGFSPFRIKTKAIKLQLSELALIEGCTISNPTIVYVRDLFIFSCFTGLAYADVMALRQQDLQKESENLYLLKIYRDKGDGLSPVPLFKKAVDIINIYKDHPKAIANGTLFPLISNQDVNRSIHIIREICGIDKYFTFHTARHTFATAVTLKSGVPIETVSKMLGHSKISTTQIYAEVDEEKILDDMDGIEEVFNKRMKRIRSNNEESRGRS